MKPRALLVRSLLVLQLAWVPLTQLLGDTFSFALTPQKTNLIIGEPLFLTAVLSNASHEACWIAQSAEAPRYYGPGGMGEVGISTNGVDFRTVCLRHPGDYEFMPFRLLAGETNEECFTLLFDYLKGLVFRSAGTYSVRVQFKFGGSIGAYATTNFITEVRASEPIGEDLVVWQFLQTNRAYADLARSPGRARFDDAELDQLTAMVRDHPSSTYAPLPFALSGPLLDRGGTRARIAGMLPRQRPT